MKDVKTLSIGAGIRRYVEASFHARGEAAWQAFLRSGVSVPADVVFGKIQAKLDARREQLRRDRGR